MVADWTCGCGFERWEGRGDANGDGDGYVDERWGWVEMRMEGKMNMETDMQKIPGYSEVKKKSIVLGVEGSLGWLVSRSE